jgi:hypothetical protein
VSENDTADLIHDLAPDPVIRQFVMTVDPPHLAARTSREFYDHNPSLLVMDLPRIEGDALYQVSISATSDEEKQTKLWRHIIRQWKKNLTYGVTVINPDTGASVYERTFGYTRGALALERNGVQMHPVAGGNLIRLSQEPYTDSRLRS